MSLVMGSGQLMVAIAKGTKAARYLPVCLRMENGNPVLSSEEDIFGNCAAFRDWELRNRALPGAPSSSLWNSADLG
jgi:hypothetical protein